MVDGRRERGEATRRQLLSSATDTFAELGFATASVRLIAERAGVHAALLRYHFGSKAGLWEQVIIASMDALRDRLLGALAEGNASLTERVLSAYLDHLAAEPLFPSLVLRGVIENDPVVISIAMRHLRPLLLAAEATVKPERRQHLRDTALTLFGASVAPHVYAPLLGVVFDENQLHPDIIERRREHLMAVLHRLEAQWSDSPTRSV